MRSRWSLGSDPEVFLCHPQTSDFVPVCGRLGGTKEKPIAMTGLGTGYAVQEDNVMLEFNIPACDNARIFTERIGVALAYVWDLARTRLEANIAPVCSAVFPTRDLLSKGALTFGCSPDFNAYQMGAPHPRVDPKELRTEGGEWRFAGGHVHLGFGKDDVPPFVAAQFADLFLGLPSVRHDKQGKRRELYGKAGRYRPTKYGIEYRTLSNFWLFDPGLLESVAHGAERLVAYLTNNSSKTLQKHHAEIPWPDVQTAIETENEVLAADISAFSRNLIKGE